MLFVRRVEFIKGLGGLVVDDASSSSSNDNNNSVHQHIPKLVGEF